MLRRLEPQLVPGVSVLVVRDNRKVYDANTKKLRRVSVGLTRQWCIENAAAEWTSFVDDDDLVPPDYVSRAWAIINGPNPPDVIGFRLRYFCRKVESGHAIHSYRAKDLPSPPNMPRGWTRYNREPNHLNPVRREIALRVGYQDKQYGEDGDYAIRMGRMNPRPREVFIDGDAMYLYLFEPQKQYEHPIGR